MTARPLQVRAESVPEAVPVSLCYRLHFFICFPLCARSNCCLVLYSIPPLMRFSCFVFLCDSDAHPTLVVVVPQSHDNEISSGGEGMHSYVSTWSGQAPPQYAFRTLR